MYQGMTEESEFIQHEDRFSCASRVFAHVQRYPISHKKIVYIQDEKSRFIILGTVTLKHSNSSCTLNVPLCLPCSRLRELILVSDQLQLRLRFQISEVVAYESFDCIHSFVLQLSVIQTAPRTKSCLWLYSKPLVTMLLLLLN